MDDPRMLRVGEKGLRHRSPESSTLRTMSASTSDNPVVATLLGADGKPIRQWLARPLVGYRKDHE